MSNGRVKLDIGATYKLGINVPINKMNLILKFFFNNTKLARVGIIKHCFYLQVCCLRVNAVWEGRESKTITRNVVH